MLRRIAIAAPAPCLVAAVLLTGCVTTAAARPAKVERPSCAADAGWNDPAAPRKIYGNTWYVGTCGISAILVTSSQGHVLLDGATQKAAPMIEANILALGFRLQDVHYIVNSHEHQDHAGGIAQLQRDTGATVVARKPAIDTLQRGHSDRGDPQFLTTGGFPPVVALRRIADGASLALGPITLTAHATPGHTPGGTSWIWTSCESTRCQRLAYVDSLTAISDTAYRYGDDARHPGVLAAFRATLATVAGLPCDILVTPHPAASNLWSRLGPGASAPLVDPSACRTYADAAGTRLDARIAQERTGATP